MRKYIRCFRVQFLLLILILQYFSMNKNSKLYIAPIIKSFIIGILITEILMLIGMLQEKFLLEITLYFPENKWIWLIPIFYLLIIITFLFTFWPKILIVIKSKRFDLLLIIFFGMWFAYAFNGFKITLLKEWFASLSFGQIFSIILFPIIIYIAWMFNLLLDHKLYQKKIKNFAHKLFQGRKDAKKLLTKNEKKSRFMSDKEITNESDDFLGFNDQAKSFAEKVFNNGSSESLVFGIDAPWGSGKSSFVNLCKKIWQKDYKDKMIIYAFNPLRYENQENLLEKFVDGLICEIRNHIFIPEIKSLVSGYAKTLKNLKPSVSLFGVTFNIPFGQESIDTVFERLENILSNIDKKIVILVDDLDRLNFSSVKEVLFVIKKAFSLTNISYVLCYDTKNITSLEQGNFDAEKVSEFLEKFINIKINICLDSNLLINYFIESKDKSLSENFLADPTLVSKAVEGLKDIFDSKEFHRYVPLIGDARKLKRLINIILLLEVEKTDFDNCDFDKTDLIHLLLLYINYPHIFRDVYNNETQGKRGFFSQVSEYDDGYDNDKNSTYYKQYLESLNENQQFILKKIFSDNILEKDINSNACFNGTIGNKDGRNLEQYLNLITKMKKPISTEQYKFYENAKNEILSAKSIKDVLARVEFSFSLRNENNHDSLWKALINSSINNVTYEKAKEIILYATEVLPQYSILEIASIGIGLRRMFTYYIAKLLDKFGWTDNKEKRYDDNVLKIADWIFGENEHEIDGILNILGQEDRGILGLYDLLTFRLNCRADKGDDIFNLARALSKHGDPNAPIEGDTRIIAIEEMREISQKVFQIFKSQYINKEKNIFDEIDNVTLEAVCGKYFDYVNSSYVKNINIIFSSLKSQMKAFIIFQLGNTLKNSITCGYYNVTGKENETNKGEISQEINKYLFEFCFNPEKNEKNYEHFLDYLLINFSYQLKEEKYIPNIDTFTKVLDKHKLADYWKNHANKIKAKNYETINKEVITQNYTNSYKNDLKSTFEILEKFYAH